MGNDTLRLVLIIAIVLAPLVGTVGWWIWRLNRKVDQLKHRLRPEIEWERNSLRGQLEHAHNQTQGLIVALKNTTAELGDLQIQLSQTRGQSEQHAIRAREYIEKTNLFEQLTIQYRDSATRLRRRVANLQSSKDQQLQASLELINRDLTSEVDELNQRAAELEDRLKEKADEGERQLGKIQALDREVEAHRERDQRILRREGRIWEPEVALTAPTFVPLHERRAPIISVINLKGGVGKTTITANLAATIGQREDSCRSLVVDLDYQRSITKLCCEADQLNMLHEQHQCIQHFLLRRDPAGPELTGLSHAEALLNSCAQVRRKSQQLFDIIGCSEDFEKDEICASLEDTESHLFAEWIIGEFTTDVRFRLREALQHRLIQNRFDYVFLDCPPRLSLAAINALAASDFVLIPVLPDETSVASVPLLLKKIDRLRKVEGLLSSLKVLGVIASKAERHVGELTKSQAIAWDSVPKLCNFARENTPFREESVHQFDQKIWRAAAFGDAAGETFPDFAISRSKDVREWFIHLVEEIEARVKDESSRVTTVSAEPQRAVEREPSVI